MTTLAESFLADLDELDDVGDEQPAEEQDAPRLAAGIDPNDLEAVAPLVHSERFQRALQARPPESCLRSHFRSAPPAAC